MSVAYSSSRRKEVTSFKGKEGKVAHSYGSPEKSTTKTQAGTTEGRRSK